MENQEIKVKRILYKRMPSETTAGVYCVLENPLTEKNELDKTKEYRCRAYKINIYEEEGIRYPLDETTAAKLLSDIKNGDVSVPHSRGYEIKYTDFGTIKDMKRAIQQEKEELKRQLEWQKEREEEEKHWKYGGE